MKQTLAILTAILISLFALPALAEDAPTVTAVGTATVTLTPDRATFIAGVNTQAKQVNEAQTANAAAMNQVLDALKAMNVEPQDLQTQNYSISPQYDYSSDMMDGQQQLIGYTVSNTVVVTVRDLAKLPELLDAAVAAGANQTYGINFESSQSAAAFDTALTAATQDAMRKAKLMADAVGMAVDMVVHLEEANDTYMYYTNSKAVAYDTGMGTPIEVGTLTVTANVRAEVALR